VVFSPLKAPLPNRMVETLSSTTVNTPHANMLAQPTLKNAHPWERFSSQTLQFPFDPEKLGPHELLFVLLLIGWYIASSHLKQ